MSSSTKISIKLFILFIFSKYNAHLQTSRPVISTIPPTQKYWSDPQSWLTQDSASSRRQQETQLHKRTPPRILLFGGSKVAAIQLLVNNKFSFTPGSDNMSTHIEGHAWATFASYNRITSHFSIFKQQWDIVYLHIGEEDLLVESVTPAWLADRITALAEYIILLGARRVVVGSLITNELDTHYGRKVLRTNQLIRSNLRGRAPEMTCIRSPMSMLESNSFCGSSRLALSSTGLHALLNHVLDCITKHARKL